MNTLATIHWAYVGFVVIAIAALVASPFLIVLSRSARATARAIAHTGSDDFRLRNSNMWTEVHHPNNGGSVQLMRLKDNNLVLVSVGITTVKVFVTPDRTDIARYRELRDFSLPNGVDRVGWPPQKRYADDLLLLHCLRRAIAWPTSADELSAALAEMDSSLLLDVAESA